jgi:uncharacterized protein YebE (UPF0316 family)
MKPLILFIIGFIELFVNICHFRLNQKNYKYASAIFSIIYIYIWAFILFNLFEDGHLNFLYVTSYAFGCGFGNYYALKYDARIEKFVKKIRTKGRKIKRGLDLTKWKK